MSGLTDLARGGMSGAYQPITMEVLKGIVTWQGQNAPAFVQEGYAGNDFVYSIINLITNKAKVAPWGVYKVKDEKKYKQYKSLLENPQSIKDWRKIEQLKEASLIPYTDDDILNELLKYPNQEDAWSDLIESAIGFKMITGNSYIYAPLIQTGKNQGKPLFFNSLPAQYMSIIADIRSVPAWVQGYQLYLGTYYNFTREEILHDKFFNPQWNASGQQLYGMSPLQSANKKITRLNESATASVANLQNGGPAGVLYMDHEDFNGDNAVAQTNALKAKLAEFSGAKNKNKIATSGYKVGWQQIGLSNVDLDIIQQEKHDLRSLCNVFGVPSTLLNDPDAKNENNQIAAEKALTVRAAIPHLTSLRDNFNRKLNTDWGYKGQGICIDFDLSAYPELQEDKKTQAEYLDISMLPLRQRYMIMGEEIPEGLSDEILNTIYYRGNPVGELGLNDPLIDPYNNGG